MNSHIRWLVETTALAETYRFTLLASCQSWPLLDSRALDPNMSNVLVMSQDGLSALTANASGVPISDPQGFYSPLQRRVMLRGSNCGSWTGPKFCLARSTSAGDWLEILARVVFHQDSELRRRLVMNSEQPLSDQRRSYNTKNCRPGLQILLEAKARIPQH